MFSQLWWLLPAVSDAVHIKRAQKVGLQHLKHVVDEPLFFEDPEAVVTNNTQGQLQEVLQAAASRGASEILEEDMSDLADHPGSEGGQEVAGCSSESENAEEEISKSVLSESVSSHSGAPAASSTLSEPQKKVCQSCSESKSPFLFSRGDDAWTPHDRCFACLLLPEEDERCMRNVCMRNVKERLTDIDFLIGKLEFETGSGVNGAGISGRLLSFLRTKMQNHVRRKIGLTTRKEAHENREVLKKLQEDLEIEEGEKHSEREERAAKREEERNAGKKKIRAERIREEAAAEAERIREEAAAKAERIRREQEYDLERKPVYLRWNQKGDVYDEQRRWVYCPRCTKHAGEKAKHPPSIYQPKFAVDPKLPSADCPKCSSHICVKHGQEIPLPSLYKARVAMGLLINVLVLSSIYLILLFLIWTPAYQQEGTRYNFGIQAKVVTQLDRFVGMVLNCLQALLSFLCWHFVSPLLNDVAWPALNAAVSIDGITVAGGAAAWFGLDSLIASGNTMQFNVPFLVRRRLGKKKIDFSTVRIFDSMGISLAILSAYLALITNKALHSALDGGFPAGIFGGLISSFQDLSNFMLLTLPTSTGGYCLDAGKWLASNDFLRTELMTPSLLFFGLGCFRRGLPEADLADKSFLKWRFWDELMRISPWAQELAQRDGSGVKMILDSLSFSNPRTTAFNWVFGRLSADIRNKSEFSISRFLLEVTVEGFLFLHFEVLFWLLDFVTCAAISGLDYVIVQRIGHSIERILAVVEAKTTVSETGGLVDSGGLRDIIIDVRAFLHSFMSCEEYDALYSEKRIDE